MGQNRNGEDQEGGIVFVVTVRCNSFFIPEYEFERLRNLLCEGEALPPYEYVRIQDEDANVIYAQVQHVATLERLTFDPRKNENEE